MPSVDNPVVVSAEDSHSLDGSVDDSIGVSVGTSVEGSVSEVKNDSASISVFVAASVSDWFDFSMRTPIAGSFGGFVDALVLVSDGTLVGG